MSDRNIVGDGLNMPSLGLFFLHIPVSIPDITDFWSICDSNIRDLIVCLIFHEARRAEGNNKQTINVENIFESHIHKKSVNIVLKSLLV